MNEHIRLLDCTLRDGGHIVGGQFGKNTIKDVIEKLVLSHVDIIEAGFLWENYEGIDSARFHTINELKKVLPNDMGTSKLSLMADFISLDHLEPYDGTVEYIRLSFKRWRLEWAITTAKVLMDKGYKVFINPVNNNVYSDEEYLELLDKVNELHPYGFSIVDTFGVMRVNELTHRYMLVDNNLRSDITIGVHLHENLGLAFSLAQQITKIANPMRDITIDGSLLGMGRVPGNLCIEQIMDFMNYTYGKRYDLEPVYDCIDDHISKIKSEHTWGYAIPYALSAKYYLHRTYAEYLIGKNRLKTKDVQRILSSVSQDEAESFNEEYIEKLYHEYLNVKWDDAKDIERLKAKLACYDSILIISPGQTIMDNAEKIRKYSENKVCVISVNFIPLDIKIIPDMIFVTNSKRLDAINRFNENAELISTSNLCHDDIKSDYTISYNNLAYFDDEFCDDSTLMLISLLSKIGIKEVSVAGFDGFINGVFSYYNDDFNNKNGVIRMSDTIKKILKSLKLSIKMEFITFSGYEV